MGVLELSIFVSSPGDVVPERRAAERVVAALNGKYSAVLHISPIFWEYEPVRATMSFQDQIPDPGKSDIVVCILFGRLGTQLPDTYRRPDGSRYPSGTAYEFEVAAAAYAASAEPKKPDILVYQKRGIPPHNTDDRAERRRVNAQLDTLDDYLTEWFRNEDGTFKAGFSKFDETYEFERDLGKHLEVLIEDRLARHGAAPGSFKPHAMTWLEGSPYRGLQVFEAEHAAIFFGRAKAIGKAKDRLVRRALNGCAFLMIFGGSGVGKSSLVRAGLVPEITAPGAVDGVGLWVSCIMKPGTPPDPLTALIEEMLAAPNFTELSKSDLDVSGLRDMLRGDRPDLALRAIRSALHREATTVMHAEGLAQPPVARLIVLIDQFEELLQSAEIAAEDKADFVRVLGILARSGDVWVVATMRNEFLHRCGDVPGLIDLKDGPGGYELLPPIRFEMSQMVRKPAEAAGLVFEETDQDGSLADVLVDAAAADPASLPLLQFMLDGLYEAGKNSRVLSFKAYRDLGGLTGAVAHYADTVLEGRPAEEQAALPALLRALMTIRAGGGPVTARYVRDGGAAFSPSERGLVEALITARLLVRSKAQGDTDSMLIRVAHEALLTHWDKAKAIAEQDRAFLETRSKLREDAHRWAVSGQAEEYLLPKGNRLLTAQDLLTDARLDRQEQDLITFIKTSLAQVQDAELAEQQRLREEAERERHLRRVAEERRDVALRHESRFLSILAELETLAGNTSSAMRMALDALPKTYDTPDRPIVPGAEGALARATSIEAQKQRLTDDGAMNPLNPVPEGQRDIPKTLLDKAKHARGLPIECLQISKDRQHFICGFSDGTSAIWDMPSETERHLLDGHTDWVSFVTFDPSGDRAATASWDKTVRLWDCDSGACLGTCAGHVDVVVSVAFSADGTQMITGSWDRTARIWDVATGDCLRVIDDGRALNNAFFSETARYVLTVSRDARLRVWSAATGARIAKVYDEKTDTLDAAIPQEELSKAVITVSGQELIDYARRILDLPEPLPSAGDTPGSPDAI